MLFKTFSDFLPIGQDLVKPAVYDRRRKRYTATCEFGESRAWAEGDTKEQAQWNAMRWCYAYLKQQEWRESVLAHYASVLAYAEKRLRGYLNHHGAKLDRFKPVWHRNSHTNRWMLGLSVDYTIDPHDQYPVLRHAHQTGKPADFGALLNGIVLYIERLDFDAIRFAKKHDAHKQTLRAIGYRAWDKFPRRSPAQAQPGDYLIREYRGTYVQLVSVSPTGAVIKVREFLADGTQRVVRLTGQDKIVKYICLTPAEFEARKRLSEKHHAMNERLVALLTAVEAQIGD